MTTYADVIRAQARLQRAREAIEVTQYWDDVREHKAAAADLERLRGEAPELFARGVEFGICTPFPTRLHRGEVIAASREEAVEIVAHAWFAGVREHAEASVAHRGAANHRPWLVPGRAYSSDQVRAAYAGWSGRESYEQARAAEEV